MFLTDHHARLHADRLKIHNFIVTVQRDKERNQHPLKHYTADIVGRQKLVNGEEDQMDTNRIQQNVTVVLIVF